MVLQNVTSRVTRIPSRRPIRWTALRADEAQRVIRDWAQDTGRVIITDHAFDRLDERGPEIDTPTVYRILRTGQVFEQPIRNERGHWQAIMIARMPGGREAGTVTVILREDAVLIVRTVMWMDVE
jgi:hypothetical protein